MKPPQAATPSASNSKRQQLVLALLAGLACVPALASGSDAQPRQGKAGEVVFANGPVYRIAADGQRQPLHVGDTVRVGDRFETGGKGYLHFKMIDQAFIAVRPHSRLEVELYEFQAQRPEQSRIRINLQDGQSRAVSGLGGESARHQYRFNTPVAAIGLRGTDYTVRAAADFTRVSVASGAVAVAPFDALCTPHGLGPCATTSVTELAAGQPNAYVEVNANQRTPVIVAASNGAAKAADARSTEQKTADSKSEVADTVPANKEVLQRVLAERTADSLAAQAEPPALSLNTRWGRWAQWAAAVPEGSPAVARVFDPARQSVVAGNDVFALFQPATSQLPGLPDKGVAYFRLDAAEAYTLRNGQLQAATVSNPQLSIDFNNNAFATRLDVAHSGGQVDALQAQGRITPYGDLRSDAARSNVQVLGAVLNKGQEAAYLFNKPLETGAQLLGAARWFR